eukprot:2310900-Rhodomonas_salina.1
MEAFGAGHQSLQVFSAEFSLDKASGSDSEGSTAYHSRHQCAYARNFCVAHAVHHHCSRDGTECCEESRFQDSIMPTLIGKLQMAEGDENLAEVKLWSSALIRWGKLYKENPLKFSFEQLKHFEHEPSEDYNSYAKRPCLNPSIAPAVAFTAEDVNEFVSHAYTAGAQGSAGVNPNIVCWNCNGVGHLKAVCPHPHSFDANCNSGFGGAGGVGGVGGAGRASGNFGGCGMCMMQGSGRNMGPGSGSRFGLPGSGTPGSGARFGMPG